MSRYVLRRFVTGVFSGKRSESRSLLRTGSAVRTDRRSRAGERKDTRAFDVSLLRSLVCPLSKKPLRYDEKTNELINEELGIAYPIIDGIPNMIPQDARMIQKTEAGEKPSES